MNTDDDNIVKELVDMQFDEVSLVDRGANQHAKVLLSKRDDAAEDADEVSEDVEKANPTPGQMTTPQPLGNREDEEDDEEDETVEAKKSFADAARSLVEKMGFRPQKPSPLNQQPQPPYGQANAAMQAPQHSLPPVAPQPPQPMAPQPQMQPQMPAMPAAPPAPGIQPGTSQPPLPQEVVDYIKALEQQVLANEDSEQATPDQQENGSMGFAKSDDTTEFLEALAKNLEDANQSETAEAISKAVALVEEANLRAERAEAIAKMEQQVRLDREFIAKAREFQHLSVSPEEFGPVLKAVYENLDEEQVQTLEKALTGLDSKMTGLFEEVGKSISYGAEEHISKAEAEAERISKDEGISKEQALAKAYESNPALYDEYLTEG